MIPDVIIRDQIGPHTALIEKGELVASYGDLRASPLPAKPCTLGRNRARLKTKFLPPGTDKANKQNALFHVPNSSNRED